MRALALVFLLGACATLSVSPDSALYEPIVQQMAAQRPDKVLLLVDVRLAAQPPNVRTVSARSVAKRVPRGAFGVIQLSKPVMQGDRAEVEVSFVCGPVCGDGTRVILEKRGEGWVIVEKVPLWTS